MILKSKWILLDDDNTAFAVEPYLPSTRILRCYNCQAYDDHIAAHCPNKNNSVCFRCSWHHLYNSNCDNPFRCTHCEGNRMVGNPSCLVKSEKHHEKKSTYESLKWNIDFINSTKETTLICQYKRAYFGIQTATNNTTTTITKWMVLICLIKLTTQCFILDNNKII